LCLRVTLFMVSNGTKYVFTLLKYVLPASLMLSPEICDPG
jgi:hypothetical protein